MARQYQYSSNFTQASLDLPFPLEECKCRNLQLVSSTFESNYLQPADDVYNTVSENSLARIRMIDVAERFKMEGEDNTIPLPGKESTICVASPSPRKFISWEDGDPENPYNWSPVRIREVLRRYDTK